MTGSVSGGSCVRRKRRVVDAGRWNTNFDWGAEAVFSSNRGAALRPAHLSAYRNSFQSFTTIRQAYAADASQPRQ